MTDVRHDAARRRLLKVLSALPLGLSLGRATAQEEPAGIVALAEAIHLLIARLGPFGPQRSAMIDDLAARFMASPPGGQLMADGGAALILRIAGQLPAAEGQLARLDLTALDEPARAWTLAFVRQLYSFLEVRNRVAGQPVFGQCLGDGREYTRPPEG